MRRVAEERSRWTVRPQFLLSHRGLNRRRVELRILPTDVPADNHCLRRGKAEAIEQAIRLGDMRRPHCLQSLSRKAVWRDTINEPVTPVTHQHDVRRLIDEL